MFKPATFHVLSRSFCSSSFKHIHSPLSLRLRAFSSIHNPTGLIDPGPADEFDVLISDLDYLKLNGEVSRLLGHQYLSRVPNFVEVLKPKREVHGIMYGDNGRMLYTLITAYGGQSYYVHWLYNTSSPFTFLSYEVSWNP